MGPLRARERGRPRRALLDVEERDSTLPRRGRHGQDEDHFRRCAGGGRSSGLLFVGGWRPGDPRCGVGFVL